MKTYIALSQTGYGEFVYIINANSEEEARRIASEKGAWEGFELEEVDTSTAGCVRVCGGDHG